MIRPEDVPRFAGVPATEGQRMANGGRHMQELPTGGEMPPIKNGYSCGSCDGAETSD